MTHLRVLISPRILAKSVAESRQAEGRDTTGRFPLLSQPVPDERLVPAALLAKANSHSQRADPQLGQQLCPAAVPVCVCQQIWQGQELLAAVGVSTGAVREGHSRWRCPSLCKSQS